ncbi:MAG: hypothetical protein QOE89_4192 [Pseudonocardiales bacterium]|nr:hypothetical protein [Pseudonocardiales bacterium]
MRQRTFVQRKGIPGNAEHGRSNRSFHFRISRRQGVSRSSAAEEPVVIRSWCRG